MLGGVILSHPGHVHDGTWPSCSACPARNRGHEWHKLHWGLRLLFGSLPTGQGPVQPCCLLLGPQPGQEEEEVSVINDTMHCVKEKRVLLRSIRTHLPSCLCFTGIRFPSHPWPAVYRISKSVIPYMLEGVSVLEGFRVWRSVLPPFISPPNKTKGSLIPASLIASVSGQLSCQVRPRSG